LNKIDLYKNINISISYLTNFKPNLINSYGVKLFKHQHNNKIICRNFLLFILLLKYFKKYFFSFKVSIFIKPFFQNIHTILRPPYRHKLSRHQLSLIRYYIIIAFKFKFIKHVLIFEYKQLIKIIFFFKNFYI